MVEIREKLIILKKKLNLGCIVQIVLKSKNKKQRCGPETPAWRDRSEFFRALIKIDK